MKNYVSPGENVTITAGAALTAGNGLKTGQLFGVVQETVASGADVVVVTRGVFDLAKVSAQAWTVGALIYWDDTAKNCTTTATGNLLIGCAIAAAANPSSTGRVRLNGIARADGA